MKTFKRILVVIAATTLSSLVAAQSSSAPDGGVDKVGIAKKLANPIANMISVPLQYEFSRGVGKNQGGVRADLALSAGNSI